MYEIEYYNLDSAKEDNNLLSSTAKAIVNNIESGNSYYQIFKKNEPEVLIQNLIAVATSIRNRFSDLIVVSMGGATLNPEMLVSFLGCDQASPKIHFLNNTDPFFFADLMKTIEIKNTGFIAISNSGETLETNALVGCLIREYQKNNITDIGLRAFFITNPKAGILKDIAREIGATLLPHQEGISGRYSGLSSVSLLVGLVAGVDILSYLSGANKVIDNFYSNLAESPVMLSASSIYYSNKNTLVNIGYLQRFLPFLEWYSQIIAESLGKDGKGYTPLKGLGPNDQHSMLQLYLEGPQDKYFSFFYIEKFNREIREYKTSNLDKLGYLVHKGLPDINKANFTATINALSLKKLPIRSVILRELSAETFGAITCHLMLEIIIIGHLIKVNPFNQPGVEMIKIRSKELISNL
ncbi:MAG: hypothetical protein H6911_06400 [Rickettsiaceae bacterium]|nr:hypothetical protein [Rickettsiaceae bacterium]